MWFKRWRVKSTAEQPSAVCPLADLAAWLRTNTFHHSNFSDLRALVSKKQEQGLTISLCLPTFNEEKTIGKEITVLKSELMSRYPLVDEIAVMDSGSTDKTCEVARAFGAEAYLASDILPEAGARKGKGENLWKAIYQLKGDIIVYVDADINNIHARFAYGLIAPLLLKPEVKYVKAFYDRPLTVAKGMRVSGGGRVTEILIRPLFSLFFPDLTAIIQPLSGEYAARREVLESIPFPIGYGVETAHLIDVYRLWGLQAFAQTDLDQRIHRNQSTQALGKMAFGILQTFLSRARSMGLVTKIPDPSQVLRQFQVRDNVYEQQESVFQEIERPPMLEIPAYRKKFKRQEP
ncbi:MAG: glucosyl-3-phosphoglycerate synthase [Kiritimatiellae bacterium]|nr:glucosyl-3-phosphoglycerate synthase [Kiritimatiellia bacterium]